jgi:hypothetical protein
MFAAPVTRQQRCYVTAGRGSARLLRPVCDRWEALSAFPAYDLMAQEVAQAYPELLTRAATGDVQAVKHHELIPVPFLGVTDGAGHTSPLSVGPLIMPAA